MKRESTRAFYRRVFETEMADGVGLLAVRYEWIRNPRFGYAHEWGLTECQIDGGIPTRHVRSDRLASLGPFPVVTGVHAVEIFRTIVQRNEPRVLLARASITINEADRIVAHVLPGRAVGSIRNRRVFSGRIDVEYANRPAPFGLSGP